MSGHSKWSQIKRQKGATDQKRGAIFTKISREITIAAKQGGSDPDANFRLRLAVQKAREANMPADNIQRAVAKATGSGEGNDLHEITYEGYGPGGVAILVEAATDNRNRTVGEVRSVLTRAGGSLGETGSVAWQFESRGVVSAETGGRDEDAIAEAVIESGAEDYNIDADTVDVYTQPADLESVRGALVEAGLTVTSSELSYVTKTPVTLEARDAEQVLRLLEKLEDLDDVQKVYSNAEFSEEAIAAFSV